LAVLFFAAATVLMTWPQAARLGDGVADLWDAKLSAWIFHWDFVATLRDPLNLFQAPILYPAKYVLAFSENLYGAAVFGFPLLASGASLVLNYNVLLLLGMFLSALSAWALARYVTRDAAASLVAGLVYAFLPYKLSQLPHIHMEWGPFLCLVFLFLLRYLDTGERRDAVLLAVFAAWNFIACIQYAFFTGFVVAVVLVWEALTGGPDRRRRIRGVVVAMAVAGVFCLPFAIPYKKASDLYQMHRSIGEMTFFSAKPGYFLSAGDRNKLWGPLTTRWRGYEGDFFPGLMPLALAGAAVWRLRRRTADAAPAVASPARRSAARLCDGAAVLLAALWLWARAHPHLRLGPISLGDPGRIQVFLTVALLARLALAFPARSRFASLGDFLRRVGLDRRALLLLAVAATGVLVCLGGRTPYYRFLFQSFGAVFRAVRAAARGIVLFQVSLAVLAAWGLSLWTRGRPRAGRYARIALVIGLMTLEYRAFPLQLYDYEAKPRPVYEWLRTVDFPGGLVEWPLGFPHDCEFTLRQAEHDKPMVNGHSSFAPRPYEELQAKLRLRPIPQTVWQDLAGLRATVLLFHPHEATPLELGPYRHLVRRGLREGRIELLGAFADAGADDFAFRLASAPRFDPRLPPDGADRAAQRIERFFAVSESEISPPFGLIQVPAEGQIIQNGFWGFGWALDDSGIAEIRVGTELGPSGIALIGSKWPGLAEAYPGYVDPGNGGFGFNVPPVPPGPHTLIVTLVGRDGGQTVLRRHIVVR
jgi:hypothetical protein